jgi:effector-binding domain-containing protein
MPSPRIAAGAAIMWLACLLTAVPSAAQAPDAGKTPAQPAPTAPGQAAGTFGQEVTLPERKIVFLKGSANWDAAFETLVDAFKSVYDYLEKEGIKPVGPTLAIYTQTDDSGFDYEAAVPISQEPKVRPQGDIQVGQAPSGKALKFEYRGSYDEMDAAYEAITNYLDEKRLEAKDIFIEEYLSDPRNTPEDQLVVNIFVPAK